MESIFLYLRRLVRLRCCPHQALNLPESRRRRRCGKMIQFVLLVSLCLLVLSVDRADASGMDFADTLALILGLALGTIGILACLGRYARRLRAEQF